MSRPLLSAPATAESRARVVPAAFLTAREFLRQPLEVGSAFPASRFLVNAVLEPLDLSAARLVVEFGPGSGAFTRAMLDRMPQNSHLVAIDISPRFIRHLRRMIPDPRLHAVSGSAERLGSILKRLGLGRVDLIVTGIPFSTLDLATASRIVDISAGNLVEGGEMLAYQMRDTVGTLMAERFGRVETSMCWRNIPPCRIYRATAS